ncbi:MAG: hypothetical protein E6931_05740 [Clostridium botulinum]|nr:hypothetical protein [Clostridium botulinum]
MHGKILKQVILKKKIRLAMQGKNGKQEIKKELEKHPQMEMVRLYQNRKWEVL